ncbi:unnamed protein product [Citrullus colocynthis]|uniref:Uncharacterized protein n=1 Tax=Citrullus colocynthis TaxID=252529 RepID=A0ABP0YUP5_9ROSI
MRKPRHETPRREGLEELRRTREELKESPRLKEPRQEEGPSLEKHRLGMEGLKSLEKSKHEELSLEKPNLEKVEHKEV